MKGKKPNPPWNATNSRKLDWLAGEASFGWMLLYWNLCDMNLSLPALKKDDFVLSFSLSLLRALSTTPIPHIPLEAPFINFIYN